MENIIIIFAVILFAAAVFEITEIFFNTPYSKSMSYVSVLPVFGTDVMFPERLEKLAVKSGGRSRIIIVYFSPDSFQKQLCEQFCINNPDTVITDSENLEKILSEMFAIDK